MDRKNSFLFQLTGTIKRKTSGKNEQVLDKLKVERERGITGTFNSYNVKNSYQYFFSQGSDGKVSWTIFFWLQRPY
jgi:translation elongation factor EF-4